MKIAFFSTKSYDKEYFEAQNDTSKYVLEYFKIELNAKTANLAKGFEAICVFVNDKIDAATIAILKEVGIKLILLRCAGYNNIDIENCSKNGIKIYRVPAYSPHAVAEHALALILTLDRKTHKAYNRIREYNFSIDHLIGFNLYEKTVGIIGTGLIGSVLCEIMLGLGCKVLAYDVHINEDLVKKGVQYTSLADLYHQCDIISLHCPLLAETNHLINEAALNQMKQGVMLINTSRGGLVDTEAVIEALKTGKVGYLGIDVYEQEANLFFKDLSETILQDELIARLMTFPNVLITSHQGFFTKEAMTQIAQVTFENIQSFEKQLPSKNEVK